MAEGEIEEGEREDRIKKCKAREKKEMFLVDRNVWSSHTDQIFRKENQVAAMKHLCCESIETDMGEV